MIRYLIILMFLFLLVTNCDAQITADVKPGWHTDNVNLMWYEQYFPSYYELEYQLYLMSMYTPEDEYTILGRVNAPPYSFFPTDLDGDYLLGINAIKLLNGEDWMEGETCWSNDPTCVFGENIFYLKVTVQERGINEPITKWKIMWK